MDLLQLVALIILFLLALHWLGTYKFAVIKSLNIPGSKPWPFVGNIPDIWKYGSVNEMFLEYRKRYGKVFYVCIGQQTSIIVADPELVKLMAVKEFDKFRNRAIPIKVPPPYCLGVGLASDGDWKRIRSTLTPTFSGAKMRQMVPLVQQSCDVLISKFHTEADAGNAININQFCQQYVLEMVMSIAFGMEINVQTQPQKELTDNVKKLLTTGVVMNMILQSLPFYSHVKRLLGHVKKTALPYQFVFKIASQIIDQRKKLGTDIGRKDLLHLMLTTKDSEGHRMLTDDEISAQSVSFLTAGLHSTGCLLKNALYLLARFPDVQEKLHDELESAFQANPDKPIYDLVQEMEYFNCFYNELLRVGGDRMTSLVLIIMRECAESCTLNGIYFPAGIPVLLSYHLIHHDPDFWKEPFKFDPERFRGPEKEQRQPNVFNPFGMGPRNCIGMRLAQMEIRITIARLVRELRFMLSPEAKYQENDLPPELVELRVERRLKK